MYRFNITPPLASPSQGRSTPFDSQFPTSLEVTKQRTFVSNTWNLSKQRKGYIIYGTHWEGVDFCHQKQQNKTLLYISWVWKFNFCWQKYGATFPTAFQNWHHGSSWYLIFYLCAKFQLSGMIISVSRTPHPQNHRWRTLKVHDWILGGWGHFWHHGLSRYVILDLYAKFQLSSMKKRSVSRTPRPRYHTWRKLKVPELILGRWSYSWHQGLSWHVILDLCDKFQLSSMNISVSRTTLSSKSYLEDVDGS